MSFINCTLQPKLTNIEFCPNRCPNGCRNGYCDCATGQCLCNPGFSGLNCSIDTCTAARCIHGTCAARYLGESLPVTSKACVCMDGWYGDQCNTTIPPPSPPEPIPACLNGCYFYINSDIVGGNLALVQSSDPKECCAACYTTANCSSWVSADICYLKIGTQRIYKAGIISGIKCSLEPNSTTTTSMTTAPTTTITTTISSACNGKCQGQYPYGCNPSFPLGYCNAGGGCTYSATNSTGWCCFKGCN